MWRNTVYEPSVGESVRRIETKEELKVGGKYNWRNQPERLVYKGYNFSGNGYWHQFVKVEDPGIIWCECLDSDLNGIEETKGE